MQNVFAGGDIIKSDNFDMKSFLKNIFKASIMLILATAASLTFDYFGFAETNIIILFILSVIIIYVTTTGYFIGTVSSIISVLIFNYLFTVPRYSFAFYDKGYWTTFILMFAVDFIIGTLTARIQKEVRNSLEQEKLTETLYNVSKKLLSAKDTSDIAQIGTKFASVLINRATICYIGKDNVLSEPYIYGDCDSLPENKSEQAVAYWTYINEHESGAGTHIFSNANGYYVPIKGKKVLGVLGIFCSGSPLSDDSKFIFKTVASQMAIALDREILSEKQEDSKMEVERERLRSNLLRSISHDLRSPLAGIKGAVSTILDSDESISKEDEKKLLNGVYDDTEWLIRLVENLLSMTRLDEGMKIEKEIEAVEEVVYEAVHRSSKNFADHKIKINIPDDVILVPMDGSLIEQVLINLIDNAAKFSPAGSVIQVNVYEKDDDVYFEVADNGRGISEKIMPYIFKRFFTDGNKISDSRRGVGLGLAICKSIVEAHGGTITAANRKEGGAVFKFNIPKEKSENNNKKEDDTIGQ